MRKVSNRARGCGKLKRGGCYLQGRKGPGGNLKSWSWVLGEPWFGGRNLYADNPSRSIIQFNGVVSLLSDEIVESIYLPDSDQYAEREHLAHIPARCLLDHVGAAYYTPWQFAMETDIRGPSRRVTPDFAAMIAEIGIPIPIFFTHKIPVCESVERAVEYATALLLERADVSVLTPTWHDRRWGITSGKYAGGDHLWMGVLRILDDEPQYLESLPASLEMIFGVSWITEAVYVAREGETELPDYLKGSKIEIVELMDETEEGLDDI